MATDYTSDEIQAVVDQLVRSSIRRPYDTLGTRRTDVTFSDFQEAASGVFLLYPKSPFYLAFLAGKRLQETVDSLGSAGSDLLGSLRSLRKRSLPIRDVSSLINAKVALFELEGSVSGTKRPKDVTKVAAYSRFNSNIDRFLKQTGSNIKQNGQIVPTPEEARGLLPEQVTALKTTLTEVVRRTGYLKETLNDYHRIDLPKLLAQGVISRARVLLSARAEQLSKMTERERLTVLRETVLELLGIKTTVNKFSTLPNLTTNSGATGMLVPFADPTRPAIPASVEVPAQGLLALVPGINAATSTNQLDLWVNGAPIGGPPSSTVYLVPSLNPRIDGLISGPFTIVASQNDALVALVDGTTTVTVPLTAGVRTATQVASDITAALTPSGFKGEAYFSPLNYDGIVKTNPANEVSMLIGMFPVTVHVGDEIDIYYGPDATTTRVVLSVASPSSFTVDGPPLTTSSENRIQLGGARRVRITAVSRLDAVVNKRNIQLQDTSTVNRNTGIALGMFGTIYTRGRGTDVAPITKYISENTTLVDAQVRQSTIFTGTAATDPSNASLLIFTDTTGFAADMTVTVPSGANAGSYVIDSVTSSTGVKLRAAIPFYRSNFGQGVSLSVTVGFDHYVVRSKNLGSNSQLAIRAPKENGQYTEILGPVAGTTTYVTFPGASKQASEGDLVDFYVSSTSQPSQTYTVTRVFTDDVLQLNGSISLGQNWSLNDTTLPYARLSVGHVTDFEVLSASLSSVLTRQETHVDHYFTELSRLINPLLHNENPTDYDIRSAEVYVGNLLILASDITTAIQAYQPTPVPELSQLIRTYQEKGADRAIDVLLEGRFSDFFNLNQEETSYAGNLQKAMRAVAQNDLPVHKTNRLAARSSPLKSSSPSTNYEYDSSDLDTTPSVDPPTDIDTSTH